MVERRTVLGSDLQPRTIMNGDDIPEYIRSLHVGPDHRVTVEHLEVESSCMVVVSERVARGRNVIPLRVPMLCFRNCSFNNGIIVYGGPKSEKSDIHDHVTFERCNGAMCQVEGSLAGLRIEECQFAHSHLDTRALEFCIQQSRFTRLRVDGWIGRLSIEELCADELHWNAVVKDVSHVDVNISRRIVVEKRFWADFFHYLCPTTSIFYRPKQAPKDA
jgi:hypothetical protein